MFGATKDPSAILNYSLDWALWLVEDTIQSSSWSGGGLSVVSSDNSTTTASVVVSGGTAGKTYDLTNTITTAAGLVDQRTIRITVAER